MNWKKGLVIAGLGLLSIIGLKTAPKTVSLYHHDDTAFIEESLKEIEEDNLPEKSKSLKKLKSLQNAAFKNINADLKPEDLDLFNLEKLVNTDLSPKKVKVDILGVKERPHKLQEVIDLVAQFYRTINIDLDIVFIDKINKQSLKPAEHLAIEIKNQAVSAAMHYLLSASGYANVFANQALIFPYEKSMSAFLPFCPENKLKSKQLTFDDYLNFLDKEERKNVRSNAIAIIHELGHLFGLYHTFAFEEDLTDDYLEDNNPNCMSYELASQSIKHLFGCGFNDLQKKIAHSYLSKERIYQAYKKVDFDYDRYMVAMSKANDWLLIEDVSF